MISYVRIFVIRLVWLLFFALSFRAHQTTAQETEKTDTDVIVQTPPASRFGEDLFRQEVTLPSFNNALFPEHYLLGPGDKLGIFLSGKTQHEFIVIVNVEGKIQIPTVGVFDVNGMTLRDFHTFIVANFSKFYSNVIIDVMLIEPKSVQAAVVGEVNQPGKYVLTALNTVVDAVISAGGPTAKGSYRDIQLYRGGKLVYHVDLYDFLIEPDQRDTTFLALGDRIFIPLVQDQVATLGELKRPMIFELLPYGDERLSDIIALAGGFTENAYPAKIEISRVEPDGKRLVMYVDYSDIAADARHPSNIVMRNDDRVRVFSRLDQLNERVVYIHGEVKRPGTYPLEDNLRLSDLIFKAGNMTRSAYMLEAEIAKVDPKSPTRFIKIDLERLISAHDPEQDVLLEEDDRVFIRQIPEWEVGPTVEVGGEVMFPGLYSITEDSTRLSEIMARVGGFTDEALIREAKLIRKSSRISIDKEYERLKQMARDEMSESEYQYLVMRENAQDIGVVVVDFYKLVVRNDTTEDVLLENGDQIIVPKKPKVVYVTGRVSRPGGILHLPKKKLKYYLEKAGGTTWDADYARIKITTVTGEILSQSKIKEFRPGDIIWVPRKPDRDWWQVFTQTITVAAQIATIYLVVDNALNK